MADGANRRKIDLEANLSSGIAQAVSLLRANGFRVEKVEDPREYSIHDVNFSPRVLTRLRNERIETLSSLVEHSAQELLRAPNFGKKAVEEVRTVLATYGLSLSGER